MTRLRRQGGCLCGAVRYEVTGEISTIQAPTNYCDAPVARQAGEEWATHDPDTGALVVQAIEPGRE